MDDESFELIKKLNEPDRYLRDNEKILKIIDYLRIQKRLQFEMRISRSSKRKCSNECFWLEKLKELVIHPYEEYSRSLINDFKNTIRDEMRDFETSNATALYSSAIDVCREVLTLASRT